MVGKLRGLMCFPACWRGNGFEPVFCFLASSEGFQSSQNGHCWFRHSAGGPESPEYQKLRDNFGAVIHHLGAARVAEELADKLFAKKLITNETREEASLATHTDTKKMRVLLPAVLTQVEIEPSNYHKFIQILSSISGAEDMVKLLRLWFYLLVGFILWWISSTFVGIMFTLVPAQLLQLYCVSFLHFLEQVF